MRRGGQGIHVSRMGGEERSPGDSRQSSSKAMVVTQSQILRAMEAEHIPIHHHFSEGGASFITSSSHHASRHNITADPHIRSSQKASRRRHGADHRSISMTSSGISSITTRDTAGRHHCSIYISRLAFVWGLRWTLEASGQSVAI